MSCILEIAFLGREEVAYGEDLMKKLMHVKMEVGLQSNEDENGRVCMEETVKMEDKIKCIF